MRIGQFVGLSERDLGALQGPSMPRGAIRLDTSIGGFDSENMMQMESVIEKDRAHIVWATPDGALRVASDWRCDETTGVWQRTDVLTNAGAQAVIIHRVLARFVLAPGTYEVYSQSSRWCKENQGTWQPLANGLVLRSEGGQTCRGASPFICVREMEQKTGMAFHVLPLGNWTIRATTHTARNAPLPFAIVELGLDDDHLRLSLAPRQSLTLPDVLFHILPNGDPARGAPLLHRYLSTHLLPPAWRHAPVIYNTWFDNHEWFTVDRLRRQLATAKQIGCEVFVVDAGWYGAGAGGWSEQVGDWREKLDGAFQGRMADFANEVRRMGLGFGLWMEPERLGAGVPIVTQHPQWFITTDGKFYYPNLENTEAYAYIKAEMGRLVETYNLVWMKVDFNFERGIDPSGAEYAGYYQAWYRLMDELHARYPGVFFEGCASGGLRLDLNTLRHFNAHFLSDTVTPLDVLRISQGALLRLPPGRITKWAVLSGPRATSGLLPRRGANVTMAPVGANWRQAVAVNVDFAARVALPGLFGISGDIAGLPKAAQQRLAYHIGFFKKWRTFIAESVAHVLTPPRPIEDGKGWAVIQLQNPADTTSLVFAYRLDDPASKMRIRLHDLDPNRVYSVSSDERSLGMFSGKQLMEEGVLAAIPGRHNAQVLVVTPS